MAIVKQHRHYWPGWKNPEELGWHDASVVHAKYPTAHEHIHSEREVERAAKPKGKVKPPEFSYDEFGEPVIPPPPPTEAELFAAAVAEAEEALKDAAKKQPARK